MFKPSEDGARSGGIGIGIGEFRIGESENRTENN